MLIHDVMASHGNLRSILSRRKHAQSPIQSDSNSVDHSTTSLPPFDIERRNVIMPRICYFARVAGTGARQKLCLPYNDNTKW
jgi:hypothetical protein